MITSIESALVVDDDALMREFVVETLKRSRIAVTEATNGLDAQRLLEHNVFDMAFVDMKMPGLDGLALLRFMQANRIPTLPVIITAFGTIEKAVEVMKAGAYDFLMKPFSPEQVEIIINRARDWVGLQQQNRFLREELGWTLSSGRKIIGQSEPIRRVMREVDRVAASSSTVLIGGESGTGKELIALAIHALSARRDGPFVRMNCAAVPDTLMDSELFGHERGAFTNAVSRRVGRFELAHHGTLLLDEITEMNLGVQAKLLRVLQEHELERVGGSQTIRVDCRIIATTNRNLQEYVAAGRFRHDLFYRLNVVPIVVPSLRDRRDDIPALVQSFVERHTRGRSVKGTACRFSDEAMQCLQKYDWPGNVRELENLIERICVMEEGPVYGAECLPPEIAPRGATISILPSASDVKAEPVAREEFDTLSLPTVERRTILRALRESGGNRKRTAEILEISVRTLRNKLNEYRQTEQLPAEVA